MPRNGAETSGAEAKTRGFYDRIADVHNLAMKLNGYRNSVAKYLRSLDLDINEGSRVLDAGSGTGIVTLAFHSAGFKPRASVALDLSLNSLKVARQEFRKQHTKASRAEVVQGNILVMPFGDDTFDLVLTCGVLEYVPLDEGLREMARVLKPGSKLVLIPVRPSLIGSILEFLYSFRTHPLEDVRVAASRYFHILGNYDFPLTEPIGWSKTIFLLEKK
jgi:ubiquinone/menaquinone biosynthesis C-methylase UbiE